MSTSGNIIVNGALELIGVKDPEATATAAMLSTGLRRLNMLIGQLNLSPLNSPVNVREVFPLVANKGAPGPSTPAGGEYTIGPGGDFNTTRPQDLTSASVLFTNPVYPNEVELFLALLTDQDYNGLLVKDLPNSTCTGLYFNEAYAGGLATINLWPVPNTTSVINNVVLYHRSIFANIVNGTATYDLPPGADEMFEYQLAMRLAPTYKVPLQDLPDVVTLARTSLSAFKRANVEMADLANDAIFSGDPRGLYNIQTGQ
jgi:hypothetical protein